MILFTLSVVHMPVVSVSSRSLVEMQTFRLYLRVTKTESIRPPATLLAH